MFLSILAQDECKQVISASRSLPFRSESDSSLIGDGPQRKLEEEEIKKLGSRVIITYTHACTWSGMSIICPILQLPESTPCYLFTVRYGYNL